MIASGRSQNSTLFFTPPTLRLIGLHRTAIGHIVTCFRTRMISTFQLPTTGSPTGPGLRVPTGPLDDLVAAEARRVHLYLALGMRQLTKLNGLRLHVPRPCRLPILIHRLDHHRVVALGLTRMRTLGGVVGQIAGLATRRTLHSLVAIVHVLVVTFGRFPAGQMTFRRFCFLRQATVDFDDCAAAAAL